MIVALNIMYVETQYQIHEHTNMFDRLLSVIKLQSNVYTCNLQELWVTLEHDMVGAEGLYT